MGNKDKQKLEREAAEQFLRSQGLDMESVEASIKQTAAFKARLKRRGRLASRAAEATAHLVDVEVSP